jgi:hypothetical protein
MGILFPVILSRADLIRAEAKACAERSRRDLMPVSSGDEILSFGFAQDRRFAQDDNGRHLRPATNVSATNVFCRPKWPALTALIALTPGTYRRAMRRPCVVDEKPPAEIPETLKIEVCGATPAGRCVDIATLHGGDGPFCWWSEPWPS